jgi:hypothetical protein
MHQLNGASQKNTLGVLMNAMMDKTSFAVELRWQIAWMESGVPLEIVAQFPSSFEE